ncbi:11250_t:CDS:1, partial [Cetraspora pellucida]
HPLEFTYSRQTINVFHLLPRPIFYHKIILLQGHNVPCYPFRRIQHIVK